MSAQARPTVTVVIPFRGGRGAAARTLSAIRRLELRDGDELRIADNSADGNFAELAPDGVTVRRALGERSSYHARNVGASGARGEWLVFCDADCIPDPDLLDAYFAVPAPEHCAVLAGEISGDEAQTGLIARYSRARNFLSQTEGLHGKAGGAAATANLAIRRAAFETIGGFAEGIRSGGDVDLCWRLLDGGWTLEHRPAAYVTHRHRETLPGFLAQIARYAAGARWLDARHPGSSPRWPLVAGVLGSARDVASNLAERRFEEATFRAIDALGLLAHNLGYFASNRAAPR